MNAERLLAHYERIADAPDTIARLRRFILDLAVRGKLVPQDPEDEPASELLKRRGISLRDTRPFDLPAQWTWVDVGAVASTRLGKMLDKLRNKGKPRRYLRNVNVRWFDFDLSDVLEMRFEDSELSEFALRSGDVLICEGGEPGRAAVWDDREGDIYFQKALHRVRFLNCVSPSYFVKALRASADDGRLAEYFTGTGIKHFTGRSLDSFLFPLPPLAEQQRIVAKVDELLELCDRLEATRADREAARDRFAAASLARLNAPDPETFRSDAGFALNALPALTARADQIKQLRQTILNLAVRGKLVPQDPNDEPASELQCAMKQASILSGGKQKIYPAIQESEYPFEPPPNWRWERFDNIIDPAYPIAYGVLVPGDDQPDGVPFVRIADLSISNPPYLPEKSISPDVAAQYERTRLKGGEILMGVVGSIGKLGLTPSSWAGANIARAICRVVPSQLLDKRYVLWLLQSRFMQDSFLGDTRTLAHPTLNLTLIRLAMTPLPPLAEQQRIVAKVDELMALCDQLEASLTDADTTRRCLLDALLAESQSPASQELEAAE